MIAFMILSNIDLLKIVQNRKIKIHHFGFPGLSKIIIHIAKSHYQFTLPISYQIIFQLNSTNRAETLCCDSLLFLGVICLVSSENEE